MDIFQADTWLHSMFIPKLCIISGKTKTFHIVFHIIPPSLPWTSHLFSFIIVLQCFDTVDWAVGGASGL